MAISAGNAAVLVPVFQPGDQQHRRRIATWALTVSQDIVDIHNSISAADANTTALGVRVQSLSAQAVVVAMGANTTSTQTFTAGQTNRVITWQTEFDTHSGFNASAGVYTVPSAGLYRVFTTFLFNQLATTGVVRVYQNSATNIVSQLTPQLSATYVSLQTSCLVSCSAGDTLSVSCYQGNTNTLYNGGAGSADARTYNKLYIEKVK